MDRWLAATTVGVSLVFAGCSAGSQSSAPPLATAATEVVRPTSAPVPLPADCGPGADGVADAQARWSANGPESYRLTYRHAPGLAVPWTVVADVVDGVVVALEPNEGADGRGFAEELATVPDLLGAVDSWTRHSDNCEITWHPQLGYPTSVRTWCDNCMDGQSSITDVVVSPMGN